MRTLCRVCLRNDRLTHAMNNTVLQEIWEKLTNVKLYTNDAKPLEVCYLCYAHLKNAYQLMQRAVKADVLLTLFISNGLQHSHNTISNISSLTHDFDYSYSIKYESNDITSEDTEIKKEYKEGNEEEYYIDIKVEAEESYEEDNLDGFDVQLQMVADRELPSENIILNELPEGKFEVVLEKVEGIESNKCKLNDIPQNSELIKLDENTEFDRELLTCAILNSQPNNNWQASNICFPKEILLDPNMDISESSQSKNSGSLFQVNNASSEICNQNEDIDKNEILQEERTHVSDNSAESEIYDPNLPSASDIASSTLLYKNVGYESSDYNREWANNDFSCHICQYKCVTKGELSNHFQEHTEEKLFICKFCSYICSYKGSLNRHMQYKHSKEMSFSCHICQYKCVRRDKLNIHLRKHTKEKPYVCDLCDYRCSRNDGLKRHMQYKHTKEMNFSCHLCQYKCVRKDKLTMHLRKHTKEKPYICDLCDYRCSRNDGLKRHMQYKHTKETNFSCHLCQYKCVIKSNLSRHLRKHSKEKPVKSGKNTNRQMDSDPLPETSKLKDETKKL